MSSSQSSTASKFDLGLTPWTGDFNKVASPSSGLRNFVINPPAGLSFDDDQHKQAKALTLQISMTAGAILKSDPAYQTSWNSRDNEGLWVTWYRSVATACRLEKEKDSGALSHTCLSSIQLYKNPEAMCSSVGPAARLLFLLSMGLPDSTEYTPLNQDMSECTTFNM